MNWYACDVTIYTSIGQGHWTSFTQRCPVELHALSYSPLVVLFALVIECCLLTIIRFEETIPKESITVCLIHFLFICACSPCIRIRCCAFTAQSSITRICIWYNNGWRRTWIRCYIRTRYPISRPRGLAMGCLLPMCGWKSIAFYRHRTVFVTKSKMMFNVSFHMSSNCGWVHWRHRDIIL